MNADALAVWAIAPVPTCNTQRRETGGNTPETADNIGACYGIY